MTMRPMTAKLLDALIADGVRIAAPTSAEKIHEVRVMMFEKYGIPMPPKAIAPNYVTCDNTLKGDN